MITSEIIDKIESSKSDASGRHCRYYQLNEQEGLKLWNSKRSRNEAYDMQSYCHDFGLAPYVGAKVEIETCEGMKYGYITQHLVVVSQYIDSKNLSHIDDTIAEAWTKIDLLEAKYKTFGVIYDDITLYNTGIMPNGEYCAIDFGDFRKEKHDND